MNKYIIILLIGMVFISGCDMVNYIEEKIPPPQIGYSQQPSKYDNSNPTLCKNIRMESHYRIGDDETIKFFKDRINTDEKCINIRFFDMNKSNYDITAFGDCFVQEWWVSEYCPNGYYDGIKNIEGVELK